MADERTKQVETVLALLKQGYTAGQFKELFKGVSEYEKRKWLAQGGEPLRERLGANQARPRLATDYRLHDQAVTLTRPQKVRITSQTLREDVASRLQKAGLVLEMPSSSPVKANMNLTQAIQQGTQTAFERESVVRLDYLLGEIVPARAGEPLPIKSWPGICAMIAGS